MPRISRYKLRESDRSGFKCFEIELVKQGPWKVAGDEFDQPPPSKVPLGGEGDVAGEARANSDFADSVVVVTDTGTGLGNPVLYITAAGGIIPSFTHPWMNVTGSNAAVTVTAQPAIARGREGQILTLQVVDSSITLSHGSINAINFMDSRGSLTVVSGMIVTFIFNTGNQAWNEASRNRV